MDEKTADAVVRIFEMYLDGYGVSRIAKTLNQEGYRSTRGNHIAPRTIADILVNPKYIGNYVYNLGGEQIVVENAIPQIVPYDLWLRVQEEKKNPKRTQHRESKRTYLLTGKMYCGKCGKPYSGGSIKKNIYGSEYVYYQCYNKKSNEYKDDNKIKCDSKGVNKEYIEKLVIDEIAEKILSDDVLDKIADEAVELSKLESEKPKVPVKELKRQEKEIEAKMENLTELFIDGKMKKEILDKQNDKLNEEYRIIQHEIRKAIQLESSPTLKKNDFIEYIKTYRFESSDEEVARILINTFIERIIVFDESIDIVFKIDFDVIGGATFNKKVGAKTGSGGAIRLLPPLYYSYTYPRRPVPAEWGSLKSKD